MANEDITHPFETVFNQLDRGETTVLSTQAEGSSSPYHTVQPIYDQPRGEIEIRRTSSSDSIMTFSSETERLIEELTDDGVQYRNFVHNTFSMRNHFIPFSDPLFPELSSMEKRLDSFTAWTEDVNVSTLNLAEDGFYFTLKEDIVACFHCGVQLRGWEDGDDPSVSHALFSPYCSYLVRRRGKTFINEIQNCDYDNGEIPSNYKDFVKRHEPSPSDRDEEPLDLTRKCESTDKSLCKICYEHDADVVILPCAHMYSCTLCIAPQRRCGMCRGRIEFTLRVYL